jgi:hypothetical protein
MDKHIGVSRRIAAIAIFVAVASAMGGCEHGGKSVPSSCAEKSLPVARPSPPDLVGCTRIEITYYPSTSKAFHFGASTSLFSPAENRYLKSLKTLVVDNPDRIQALAQRLRSGSYSGTGYGIAMQRFADIVCYRGEERLISFQDCGLAIQTQDGHLFRYTDVAIPVEFTPEIYPFSVRQHCATNLYRLGVDLRTMSREGIAWPAPHEWSDVLFHRRITSPTLLITDYSKATKSIGKEFTCSGAGEGKCHYAMNSACQPDSPPDMVLLFETKAGWNQSGGLELFTFDHHDPKGGLVLLGDGTVKFIRTKEELKQLRWK